MLRSVEIQTFVESELRHCNLGETVAPSSPELLIPSRVLFFSLAFTTLGHATTFCSLLVLSLTGLRDGF